ncbi:MAG: hypothetical protein HOP16_09975 [Acidobacteria bacterium]|nr:hypothetical protein [Acidobacteriota bacterium]
MLRSGVTALLLGAATLVAASCSGSTPSAAVAVPPSEESAPVQRLNLTYDKPGVVGTRVSVSAEGLPAGKTAELRWSTVSGGWVIEDYYHFRGKKYSETSLVIGSFQIDPQGRLAGQFDIPEDYGGVHDIMAVVDGRTVAQNGIEVTQSFEMSPLTGPVGTPIEVKVKGLGWRTMESTWAINWDNNSIGWVSAASTKGSAVARFRAAGPVGEHAVKVYTGYQGQPYLNYEQSPVAHLPRPQFTFRITPGRLAMPAAVAEPYQVQPVPKTEITVANAAVTLAPTQGPVGTRARLQASGLPAGASVDLAWETAVGNRVSGDGFSAQTNDLARVTVGADGRLDVPVSIPDDVGGLHGVVLRADGQMLARTHFVIETSIVSMTPTAGPAGTPVTIHLKGVGWTEYDNIYIATYDNAYMGYACGFNSQGDVVINFTAAGEPGVHLIDLYPGIYQGPPTEPQLLYRTPQLTYADDHPGNKIPALRFAFEVTRSPSSNYGTK